MTWKRRLKILCFLVIVPFAMAIFFIGWVFYMLGEADRREESEL
jgi:cbb3-type cytochrome oxidase subunit 3